MLAIGPNTSVSVCVDDVICGQLDLGCSSSEILSTYVQRHCFNF